jgi:hypothetical protein
MKNAIMLLLGLVLPPFFFGCASHTALVPAPGAEVSESYANYATASAGGVEILVNGNTWPGREEVRTEITPVRVIVRNRSGVPVRIGYDSFELIDSVRNQYAALPPFSIDETISEPVARYYPARGYYSAGYYSPFYPGFGPFWGDPFPYSSSYYDRHYGYWREIELPTEEMLELALNEGVLEDGGEVTGFLYFEKVDPETRQVRFKAELSNAGEEGAEPVATVSIPFAVVEK